ncbi:MAG TPA: hypothetical protein VNW97_11130 [Candidatus Saccharimonadales bacterium]|jgi:hypothetical protein|nr:hypothetical protein [Candidatus Saccharimonadales bacterium]
MKITLDKVLRILKVLTIIAALSYVIGSLAKISLLGNAWKTVYVCLMAFYFLLVIVEIVRREIAYRQAFEKQVAFEKQALGPGQKHLLSEDDF